MPRSGPFGEPLERPALGLLEHLEAGNRIEAGQRVEVAAPRAPKRLGAAVPQDGLAVLHLADPAAVAGLSHLGCPLLVVPVPGALVRGQATLVAYAGAPTARLIRSAASSGPSTSTTSRS